MLVNCGFKVPVKNSTFSLAYNYNLLLVDCYFFAHVHLCSIFRTIIIKMTTVKVVRLMKTTFVF